MANPSADYPAAIHTATDVSGYGNTALGTSAVTHTDLEGKQEQELTAIQTKIGTGSSTPTSGKVLTGTGDGSSEWQTPAAVAVADVTGLQTALDAKAAAADLTSHTGNTSNPHSVTKAQVGLTNVTDEAQIPLTQKGAVDGVASLDGSGKVPSSQLPALSLTDVHTVASEVAQLALTAQEGDVAIRTDLNKSYVHNGGTAGTMDDWNELLTPTDQVSSVNGETGDVTLDKTHVGLGNVDNTSDASKPVSTAQQAALDGKAASSHTHVSADITDLSAGGQTAYDIIVDAAGGGDYTTFESAVAAATEGQTIFVRSGNYTVESAITVPAGGIEIIGENWKYTSIQMQTNVLTISVANVTIRNLTLKMQNAGSINCSQNYVTFDSVYFLYEGIPTGTIIQNSGNNFTMSNCHFHDASTNSVRNRVYSFGNYGRFVNNYFRTAMVSSGGIRIGGNYTVVANNVFDRSGQTGWLLYAQSQYMSITGNAFYGGGSTVGTMFYAGCSNSAIAGNTLEGGEIGVILAGSYMSFTGNSLNGQKDAVQIYGHHISITGNHLYGAGTTAGNLAIEATSGYKYIKIIGNDIHRFAQGITLVGNNVGTVIIGNDVSETVTTPLTITAAMSSLQISQNIGIPAVSTIESETFKNASGLEITAGSVVVHNVSAAGDEMTTTTTAGSNKVLGVVTITAVANAAYGSVVTKGKVTDLKVDGTTDIAIGDFLSCSTTAGVAKKAAAGETAFAVALEAYTADDTSGVIDALIVSPRMI